MVVPDYQSMFVPLLKVISDGEEYSVNEAYSKVARLLSLSSDDLEILLPSGQQTMFYNRVSWARTYLKKASLLEDTKRAVIKITPRGLDFLKKHPEKISTNDLLEFSEFLDFRQLKKKDEVKSDSSLVYLDAGTPLEVLEQGFSRINQALAQDILAVIKRSSPEFFEKLVVDLLVTMGYGGNRSDAGKAIGKSGDEGIDGVIYEDKLGLDTIYIQAKRWDKSPIGRPEIQKFVGALQGKNSKKGVFITTSNFTKEALDYAKHIETKVVLIDGLKLAQLMIEYNVGVLPISSYNVKSINADYFEFDAVVL